MILPWLRDLQGLLDQRSFPWCRQNCWKLTSEQLKEYKTLITSYYSLSWLSRIWRQCTQVGKPAVYWRESWSSSLAWDIISLWRTWLQSPGCSLAVITSSFSTSKEHVLATVDIWLSFTGCIRNLIIERSNIPQHHETRCGKLRLSPTAAPTQQLLHGSSNLGKAHCQSAQGRRLPVVQNRPLSNCYCCTWVWIRTAIAGFPYA